MLLHLYIPETIQRSEVIFRCLGTADLLYAAVLTQQKLCGFEFAVVVITHCEAVSTCVMDYKIIAHVDLRKLAVDRELIVVLTQGTGHIIGVVARCIFLAKDRDVMVSTIHSRTHQVYRTGIHADVLLVDMFLVDCLCNKVSIRGKHETAKLCEQADIAKSGRDKHLIEYLVYTFANLQDIIAFLIRCIRDTNTAGQVDVGKLDAGLSFSSTATSNRIFARVG